jgi:predicted TIM-barrel fold metal-dependent hydrolase
VSWVPLVRSHTRTVASQLVVAMRVPSGDHATPDTARVWPVRVWWVPLVGSPEFDPFWKRVVEHDVLVTMHSSDSGYARYTSEWDGISREMLPFQTNTFRMISEWRPTQDTVASWVCHGALFRHPELRIAVIESGSDWLPPLLKTLESVYKKAPEGFAGDPIEAIKRNIHVSPFWEEDLGALSQLIGVDKVLFGSDYPHPEGLAEPTSYVEVISGMRQEDQAQIMGGNLARLMRV